MGLRQPIGSLAVPLKLNSPENFRGCPCLLVCTRSLWSGRTMRVMPAFLPTEMFSRRCRARLDVRVHGAPIGHAGTGHWTGSSHTAVTSPTPHYVSSRRKADRYHGCQDGGTTNFHSCLPFLLSVCLSPTESVSQAKVNKDGRRSSRTYSSVSLSSQAQIEEGGRRKPVIARRLRSSKAVLRLTRQR